VTSALSPGREKFARGLAEGLTQAAAFRRAFKHSTKWRDSAVWTEASKLAGLPEVRQRVAELVAAAAEKSGVTVDRVVAELAKLAFFDIRRLVKDDGSPLPLNQLDDGTAGAIMGLEVVRVGNAMVGEGEVLKFKLADKRAALETLGRHLQMFTDKVQVTGKDGGPIETKALRDLTDDELAQEIARHGLKR
jgi:phage terminase small subunit